MVLDNLRLDEDGLCAAHCAVGRVVYPARARNAAPEDGWIVYFKLSITGDEDEIIRHYRAEHPDFPHQSTADQFFDEGQFEAYRALGFHAAEQLFAPLSADAGEQRMSYADLEAWFMDQLNACVGASASADDERAYAALTRTHDRPGPGASAHMQPMGPLSFSYEDYLHPADDDGP